MIIVKLASRGCKLGSGLEKEWHSRWHFTGLSIAGKFILKIVYFLGFFFLVFFPQFELLIRQCYEWPFFISICQFFAVWSCLVSAGACLVISVQLGMNFPNWSVKSLEVQVDLIRHHISLSHLPFTSHLFCVTNNSNVLNLFQTILRRTIILQSSFCFCLFDIASFLRRILYCSHVFNLIRKLTCHLSWIWH